MVRALLRALEELWWRIRGVGARDYRQLCARCGLTGQTHYLPGTLLYCPRFKR